MLGRVGVCVWVRRVGPLGPGGCEGGEDSYTVAPRVTADGRSKLAAQESAWARQRADARAVGEAVSGLGASVGDAAAEVADLLDGVASAGADKQTRPAVKARASQVRTLDSA